MVEIEQGRDADRSPGPILAYVSSLIASMLLEYLDGHGITSSFAQVPGGFGTEQASGTDLEPFDPGGRDRFGTQQEPVWRFSVRQGQRLCVQPGDSGLSLRHDPRLRHRRG